MLRGSMIVFSGLLSVLFLRRQLWAYNWAGIGLCVCGIILVGAAGALAAGEETTSGTESQQQSLGAKCFGMSLVIIGQLVQAAQVVVEEKILTDAATLPPAVFNFINFICIHPTIFTIIFII